MITIEFNVTETEVTVTRKTDKLTSGNVEQIQCLFNLSEVYDNLVVRAVFNGQYRTVENGKCFAPELAEGRCKIGVYAYNIENEKTVLRLSPVPCIEYVSKGSYDGTEVEADKPTQTELEAHYALIKNLIDNNNKIVIDTALSPSSDNAIANRAVANVLGGGKLLGFEVIGNYSDYQAFENISEKYIPGLERGGYVIILVTDMIYQNDNNDDDSQFLIGQGIYIIQNDGEAVLSLGEHSLADLIEELDTKYLSYDEWNFYLTAFGEALDAIRENHKNLKSSVEREFAKKQDVLTDDDKQAIADMCQEKWALLIDDTLPDDVAVGTKYGWSRDVNGNAYSVKELFAELIFPSAITANIALQINGTDASAIMWGLLPAKTQKVHIHSRLLPDGCIETEYVYKLSTDSEITAHKSLKGINGERRLTAFSKLSISSRATNGSVALPSGSIVKIWAMN